MTPPGNLRAGGPRDGWFVKARKTVCSRPGCNDTWMSDLQNSAKQVLLPMMDGEATSLSATDCHIVRRWASMTGIMMHYAPMGRAEGVDESRRAYLLKTGSPAPLTLVSLVHVLPSEMKTIIHTSYARRVVEEWPVPYAELLTMGSLGFVVLQGPLLSMQEGILRRVLDHLVPLPAYPVPGLAVTWSKQPMSVEALVSLFEELMPERDTLPDIDDTGGGQLYVASRDAVQSDGA